VVVQKGEARRRPSCFADSRPACCSAGATLAARGGRASAPTDAARARQVCKVATGWQPPPCTNRKSFEDQTAEMGLSWALSVTDGNQPQSPRLPRNPWVRGSNPCVGSCQNPYGCWTPPPPPCRIGYRRS
jgi:hypothetical protein